MLAIVSLAMVSSACVRRDVDFSNRPCPCGDGWRCDQSSNLCVLEDAGVEPDADDGADVRPDVDIDQESDVEVAPLCDLPDQMGFNEFTVRAINDRVRYPRDGTTPYCRDSACTTDCLCGGNWGQIHDGWYGGTLMFEGGGDCFSSGFTLEIFLRAFQLFLVAEGLPGTTLFQHGASVLAVEDVARDGGEFYRYWQGVGMERASSGAAFEALGIGQVIDRANWDNALPGDYVNLWRTDDTGTAAIFGSWVVSGDERVGIRYFSCPRVLGEECFEQDESDNLNGPSFRTELFAGSGGTVLIDEVIVGRANMPDGG